MSDIKKGLDVAPQTLYMATRKLKALNLVFEKSKRGFPKKVYLSLTREGSRVAESLSQVDDIVGETIEGNKKRLEMLRRRKKTRTTKQEMNVILCRLGELSFAMGRWGEALDYSKECDSLSKNLGDLQNEAKSNWILAEIYRSRGEIQTAIGYLQRSSELFAELDDTGNLSNIQYSFGAMSEREGDFEKALSHYEKSRDHAEEAQHEISLGKAVIGMGRILGRRGQYEESYRELEKAVRILEKSDALEELSIGYANLGATAFFIDVDEAFEWHKKSIEVAEKVGNSRLMGSGWMNIAGCLVKKSEYRLALEHLERAMNVVAEIDDKKMLSSLHIQFGIAYRELEKWTRSRESLGEAIDIADKWDLPYHLADAIFNLALLDARTSSIKRAKRRLERALEIFAKLKNEDKVSEVKKALDELTE
jgi:tetratricopeptide (TPR) repeat protein